MRLDLFAGFLGWCWIYLVGFWMMLGGSSSFFFFFAEKRCCSQPDVFFWDRHHRIVHLLWKVQRLMNWRCALDFVETRCHAQVVIPSSNYNLWDCNDPCFALTRFTRNQPASMNMKNERMYIGTAGKLVWFLGLLIILLQTHLGVALRCHSLHGFRGFCQTHRACLPYWPELRFVGTTEGWAKNFHQQHDQSLFSSMTLKCSCWKFISSRTQIGATCGEDPALFV